VLGSIAAHDEKRICVFKIDPVICHCPASERLSQSRNRGTMSGTGLVIDVDDTKAPGHLMGDCAFLVVGMRCADEKHRIQPVDRLAFVVLKDEILVSDLLDTGGDLLQCPFPGFFLPFAAAGCPVHGFFQAVLVAGHGEHGRALGAKCSFVDGILGISFRTDQFAFLDVGNDMAAHGTKRADGDDLTGARDFEGGGICLISTPSCSRDRPKTPVPVTFKKSRRL